ncbi:hypothetical protein [Actinoallomurus sp. NPDC050550]|uniref:hypothetical protein n=1 Tax=Actinoallomurus sp. NPDC050550 TaxID=3154937 RepID=UPI003410595E
MFGQFPMAFGLTTMVRAVRVALLGEPFVQTRGTVMGIGGRLMRFGGRHHGIFSPLLR